MVVVADATLLALERQQGGSGGRAPGGEEQAARALGAVRQHTSREASKLQQRLLWQPMGAPVWACTLLSGRSGHPPTAVPPSLNAAARRARAILISFSAQRARAANRRHYYYLA